jgi:hypothetical protein
VSLETILMLKNSANAGELDQALLPGLKYAVGAECCPDQQTP